MHALTLVALLHAAAMTPDAIDLELEDARASMPGAGWYAPAIVTMVAGSLALPYAYLIANPLCFFSSSCGGSPSLATGVALLGGAGVVVGIIWTVALTHLRMKYGARIEELEGQRGRWASAAAQAPPIESRLPAAPTLAGWAWSF